MISPLIVISAVVGLTGVVCAVAGAAMAAKRTRIALILVALFLLMTGASAELRVWSDRLGGPSHDAGEARAIAIESISIARSTRSPEMRERALKAAEDALNLDAVKAGPVGEVLSINEIVALALIVLGAVNLTLALTRPDILSTRVKRDNQTAKNSALAAATGENL